MLHRKTIGENMRRLHKARGWSQERLSVKSGLDQDYIGHIAWAQVKVSVDTLAKIAHALNVEIIDFFKSNP